MQHITNRHRWGHHPERLIVGGGVTKGSGMGLQGPDRQNNTARA
jgi:hypothetical protein